MVFKAKYRPLMNGHGGPTLAELTGNEPITGRGILDFPAFRKCKNGMNHADNYAVLADLILKGIAFSLRIGRGGGSIFTLKSPRRAFWKNKL